MRIREIWRRHSALIAAALLLIGHFAPWVSHASAALTLSAHELATVTNFTPHAGVFFNEGFLLPLWAAALLLTGARGRVALLCAVPIALLGLPAYPELRRISTGEGSPFVLQLLLTLACLAACAWLAWRSRTPRYFAPIAALCAALCAAPLIGYWLIKTPAIERLYGGSVGVGIGWWLTLIAAIGIAEIAFVTILAARSRPHTIVPGYP
jgi:hypothetical protein